MQSKLLLIPLIFSVLFLGFSFNQDAHAADFTAVQSGDWNDPATWGGAVPVDSDNKTIPSGVNVINISGTINNSGTIDNFGTITSTTDGTINNSGTIDNFGTIASARFSTINNSGTIDNFGTIKSGLASTINNSGLINNTTGATINNTRGLLTINNSGTIDNFGTINLFGNSTVFNDCGVITGNPISGNQPVDRCAPVITLLGNPTESVEQNTTYTDAGATASDDVDGDITASITTVNSVDDTTVGSYTVTYDVIDTAGNPATQVTRTVDVIDPNLTIIDSDTTGNQNVGPGETLRVTNGATVTGNITVDGGTLIIEVGATVTGNVIGKNGASITLDNGNVDKNIRCGCEHLEITNDSSVGKNLVSVGWQDPFYPNGTILKFGVEITDNPNSFGGHVRIDGAETVTVSNNSIDKNLRVKNSGDVTISGNTVGQNLRSFDNVSTTITGNTVETGNLNARGTDTVIISGNIVDEGNIRAADSTSVDITNNSSGENLRVKDSTGVTINDNQVGKNLRVLNNDGVTVNGNHADNNVNIKNNTACTHSGNTADNKVKIKDCVAETQYEEVGAEPAETDDEENPEE